MRAYNPGELFRRTMLGRLSQNEQGESNDNLDSEKDHSCDIVPETVERLDVNDSNGHGRPKPLRCFSATYKNMKRSATLTASTSRLI